MKKNQNFWPKPGFKLTLASVFCDDVIEKKYSLLLYLTDLAGLIHRVRNTRKGITLWFQLVIIFYVVDVVDYFNSSENILLITIDNDILLVSEIN